MGEARRRQQAGFIKPQKPVKKRHNWRITTPSKFVRWLVVGPEKNRAAKRKGRKDTLRLLRVLALREQREAICKERKQKRKTARKAV